MNDAAITSKPFGVRGALACVTRRGSGRAGILYLEAMSARSRTTPVEPTAPGAGRRAEGQRSSGNGPDERFIWWFIVFYVMLCAVLFYISLPSVHGA